MHRPGEIINNRYRIVQQLGTGSSGITYKAEVLGHNQSVALKVLALRGLKEWKQLELFERESKILQKLEHPAIPSYVDHFYIDTEHDRSFYIVQQLAEGQTLSDLVISGWRATEQETKQIALDVLDILVYLHGFRPSIIHRDIKPQNLIRRKDGAIFLVDFGAVQHVYRSTIAPGSTVIGTYGYMAPEQFRGVAYPGSDLYGLAATLLFLLTHRDPADLPQRRLKIEFQSHTNINQAFSQWLSIMLEPIVEDRYGSAKKAIKALTEVGSAASSSGQSDKALVRCPKGSRVKLYRTPATLILEIPRKGLQASNVVYGCFGFFLSVPILGFMILLGLGIVFGNGLPVLLSLGIMGLLTKFLSLILAPAFEGLIGRSKLQLSATHFRFERIFWGWRYQTIQGKRDDLGWFTLEEVYAKNERTQALTMVEGAKTYRFGALLTTLEKDWLLQELNEFLSNH